MNLSQASEGALLSALAYKEYYDTLLLRHPDAVIIEVNNASAVVINGPDYTVIAFAGSDDYLDWFGNIMRNKVKREGIGEVYKGVANYYGLLRRHIHAAVADDNLPVRLFGHSLGGSAAEMYAARRVHFGKPVACLHTFGSPMVGDKDFCKVSARIPNAYNWWIKGDVVPYQPLRFGLISMGYHRARNPHIIDGLKIGRKVPFWTPSPGRWLSGKLAHSCYDTYYPEIEALRKVVTP